MDSVVHFELPADDQNRSSEFYRKAFGWNPVQLGSETGNYVMVHTGPTDEKGMVQRSAFINGGIYKRTKPDQGPSVVIAVDDIREGMKRVTEAGGTVLGGMNPGEPDNIPNVGLYAAFTDTEGNMMGMLQPKAM